LLWRPAVDEQRRPLRTVAPAEVSVSVIFPFRRRIAPAQLFLSNKTSRRPLSLLSIDWEISRFEGMRQVVHARDENALDAKRANVQAYFTPITPRADGRRVFSECAETRNFVRVNCTADAPMGTRGRTVDEPVAKEFLAAQQSIRGRFCHAIGS